MQKGCLSLFFFLIRMVLISRTNVLLPYRQTVGILPRWMQIVNELALVLQWHFFPTIISSEMIWKADKIYCDLLKNWHEPMQGSKERWHRCCTSFSGCATMESAGPRERPFWKWEHEIWAARQIQISSVLPVPIWSTPCPGVLIASVTIGWKWSKEFLFPRATYMLRLWGINDMMEFLQLNMWLIITTDFNEWTETLEPRQEKVWCL